MNALIVIMAGVNPFTNKAMLLGLDGFRNALFNIVEVRKFFKAAADLYNSKPKPLVRNFAICPLDTYEAGQ